MSEKISLWQAFKSVIASFVGIQSRKNLERDSASDANLVPIITIGFILAILLHVLIYVIVKIIVWQSGVN